MEQAAGRAMIEQGNRNHKTDNGKRELQRRFGSTVVAASWELRLGEYWVDVHVLPSDGSSDVITFTERLEKFPSEECIANIALVT